MNQPSLSGTVASVWRRHLWLRPLLTLLVLAAVGWVMRARVEATLKTSLQSVLLTTLQTEHEALQLWLRTERNQAESLAADLQVAAAIRSLLANAAPMAKPSDLLNLPQVADLRREIDPVLAAHHYNGFVIIDRTGRIAASDHAELIGRMLAADQLTLLQERTFTGRSAILPPVKSQVPLPDRHGVKRTGVPTMFTVSPVFGEGGEVIAALGLRIRPEVEFTRILAIARIGATGETYAFDRDGLLLSNSRFDEQLRGLGLLPEGEDSTLSVSLRDPGVDLTTGARPERTRSELPLTWPAAEALAGRDGVNTDGYRDYRGVPVVGAWMWLSADGFGLVTELDVSESHQTINTINYAFWSLFALLGIVALAMLTSMMRADRLAAQARQAAIELRRLGQYTLEEKLGEGGMGVVYRARHAMLHRPTAVKFLDVERTSEKAIARFEREVQLTARLNHPNTIAIYDYGRTPEGVFYYAMEYLEGMTLQDLVERFGPVPEGRVVHILKQVCGSLAEAHEAGLIHRDVKPANILLNARGGLYDFVKLLDFGLVKVSEGSSGALVTRAGGVVGTPLYMSPEACTSPELVDARSDLYAVGAVGYFLLSGTPLFRGDNILELLRHQAETPPEPLSERSRQDVSPEMEELLMRCLKKSPAERPASAEELIKLLSRLSTADTWTDSDAREWWKLHQPELARRLPPEVTSDSAFAVTVAVDAVTSSNGHSVSVKADPVKDYL